MGNQKPKKSCEILNMDTQMNRLRSNTWETKDGDLQLVFWSRMRTEIKRFQTISLGKSLEMRFQLFRQAYLISFHAFAPILATNRLTHGTRPALCAGCHCKAKWCASWIFRYDVYCHLIFGGLLMLKCQMGSSPLTMSHLSPTLLMNLCFLYPLHLGQATRRLLGWFDPTLWRAIFLPRGVGNFLIRLFSSFDESGIMWSKTSPVSLQDSNNRSSHLFLPSAKSFAIIDLLTFANSLRLSIGSLKSNLFLSSWSSPRSETKNSISSGYSKSDSCGFCLLLVIISF